MEELVALIIILGALVYVVTRSLILWAIQHPRERNGSRPHTTQPDQVAHTDHDPSDTQGLKQKGENDGMDRGHA
jgi:hypothetical protein